MIRAVFFDVDFTLIYPGPTLQGTGYQAFCARHGIAVDSSRFAQAVKNASPLLDGPEDAPYDEHVFVVYTRRILEGMGGTGAALDACAHEIHKEWAANAHFELYDDVPDALRVLSAAGVQVGLISNSHRCLTSFQAHFDLTHVVSAAISSSHHGYMKPHPSIFQAALRQVRVPPADAVMVGDSVRHDVEGARRVGMGAVLLHRSDEPHPRARELAEAGIPTIASLADLPTLLHAA